MNKKTSVTEYYNAVKRARELAIFTSNTVDNPKGGFFNNTPQARAFSLCDRLETFEIPALARGLKNRRNIKKRRQVVEYCLQKLMELISE